MDDDYLFPDSTQSMSKKRSNIMDELFGKNDDVDSEIFIPFPKQQNQNERGIFSSFSPNAGNTIIDNSITKPAERKGRRGISPTVKPLSTSVPENKIDDWLELKEDSKLSAPSKTDEPNSKSWLDINEDKQAVVMTESSTPSYLDWLGRKPDNKEVPKVINTSSNVGGPAKDEGLNNRRGSIKNDNLVSIAAPYSVQEPKTTPSRVEAQEIKIPRPQISELRDKFNDDNFAATASVLDLQSQLKHSEFECRQLKAELESLQTRYQDDLAAIETSFKKRSQLMEESYERRELHLQKEVLMMNEIVTERQKSWDKERSTLVSIWQRRLDEANQERIDDLERIKELNHKMVVTFKADHDSAISRLQQIKKVEVDALMDAQSHSKTLHTVIEQLKTNTQELFELQSKVEGGLNVTLNEREMVMNSKDEQVKFLKDQLQKQKDDDEQQRLQLRQMIIRLEEKLQQQTMEFEEEKWKVTQEKNKLELERKMWTESKRSTVEQVDNERKQFQRLKDSFMEEQKQILENIQLERKRQRGSSEEMIKVEAEIGSASNTIREEKQRLEEARNRLESEARIAEIKKLSVDNEKAALDALMMQLKQRSEEVEAMCISAAQTREDGFQAVNESINLQNELKKRQELLWTRLEDVKSRERNLAEERISVAKEKHELEYLRQKLLCVRCQLLVTDDALQNIKSSTGRFSIGEFSDWRDATERDKEFLKNESHFLHRLQTPFYLDAEPN